MMSDPLSIISAVLTLLQVSVQVSVLLKQFRDEVSGIDSTLNGLLSDVASFQQVLESMRETLDRDEIRSNLQTTGHVGSHWKNLGRSLEDGEETMRQLAALLENVNKTTRFLDGPRKAIRYKSAIHQIGGHREQIQSYRAALQLSLSTVILWNQVTFHESTKRIPDRIVPTLDKLYDEFRTFGAELNARIDKLQSAKSSQDKEDEKELKNMSNLRECVRSAADVVSTTSSTLTVDAHDKMTKRTGSELGDIFVKEANEPMKRWMTSISGEDLLRGPPQHEFNELTGGDSPLECDSDSDTSIESDMIRALYKDGKRLQEVGDFRGAERKFRNCLTMISSSASSISLTSAREVSIDGITKGELLEALTETYTLSAAWGKAKTTLTEKLSLNVMQMGQENEAYLWETIRLAEIMQKNKEIVEAQLQARRSLRGFKKLGEAGYNGYEHCLRLLIQLCREGNMFDEEDAYIALLRDHRKKIGMPLSLQPRTIPYTLLSPTPFIYLAKQPKPPIRKPTAWKPHVPKKPENLRHKERPKSEHQEQPPPPVTRRFTLPSEHDMSFQEMEETSNLSRAKSEDSEANTTRFSYQRTSSAPLEVGLIDSFKRAPHSSSSHGRPLPSIPRPTWNFSSSDESRMKDEGSSPASLFFRELFEEPSRDSRAINFLFTGIRSRPAGRP